MAKLPLGIFLVLAIAVAVSAGGDCANDREGMIRECKKYAQWPANPKVDPSEACCAVWEHADVPCLCSHVTKETEKEWCMEKIVYIAKFCRRPFNPGYKCGSYTVPRLGH